MNVTKQNTVGIDVYIQRFQTWLYLNLKSTWKITNETDFDMFGRAYKNQTKDGYSPEIYNGKNEYTDLFWNDSKKAMAFFGVKEDRQIKGAGIYAECFVIFMVNADKLKTSSDRRDEEIREDVKNLCRYTMHGFELVGFCTGIDSVFDEYSGWKKTAGMKFRDTHPHYCFRLDFKIIYPIINN
jgi:hypothetical protein